MSASRKESYLRRIMTAKEMDLALSRIAGEILADGPDLSDSAVIGIRTRGVVLAERLHQKIEKLSSHRLPMGVLDITFYRDDLSLVGSQPVVQSSQLDFDVTGKNILLVDDVLYTGRTTRAALDSVLDYGRPQKIELVVLIDRGHRELPIQADYVGKYVETDKEEVVEVRVSTIDNDEGVVLTTRELLQKND